MEIRSTAKPGWLANAGCTVGGLSLCPWGSSQPLYYSFLYDFNRYELAGPLAAGFTVLFIALGGWILGLAGLVVSLIALRRIMRLEGENISKGMSIMGLVLSSLGNANCLFFFL